MVIRINHRNLDTESTLTAHEVAALTGYNVRTIQRYAAEDLIRSCGSKSKRIFMGCDVAEFLGFRPADHSQGSALIN